MELLSEYILIVRKNNQCVLVQPSDDFYYKEQPLTTRDKVLFVLRTILHVIFAIFILGIVIIGVWGMIKYPYLIIFFVLGFLVSSRT